MEEKNLNRHLSYGWLREGAVKVVKVNCPLKKLDDVVVMLLAVGLQYVCVCVCVCGAMKKGEL